MTRRGDATREKLIAATAQVVRERGYSHATTKAIAAAAGVSEGTIYRHFPDKASLFFATVLHGNASVVAEFDRLPEQAGHDTVEENLTEALFRLASLRDSIFPLEIAMLTDPDMAEFRTARVAPQASSEPLDPISAYLRAEQAIGRVRTDIDCNQTSPILLSLLFSLALASSSTSGVDKNLLRGAIHLVVHGMTP